MAFSLLILSINIYIKSGFISMEAALLCHHINISISIVSYQYAFLKLDAAESYTMGL